MSSNKSTTKAKNSVAARNAAFSKLTKAEKRVQIAKDVLQQLKTKRFRALEGTYLDVRKSFYSEPDPNMEVRDVLKGESCTVCALGATFVCTLDRVDKLKFKDLDGNGIYRNWHDEFKLSIKSEDMRSYLGKFFSRKQLFLIETAFENSSEFRGCQISAEDHGLFDEAACLYETENDANRLVLIMKNIIRNEGIFDPTDNRKR